MEILPSPEFLGEHGLLPDTVWAMPNFVRPQWHLVSEMLCRLCSHTRHLVWDSVPRALWAGTGPWWSLLTAKPETLKQQPLGFHKCIVPVCLPTHLSQENLSGLSKPHPDSKLSLFPLIGPVTPYPSLGGQSQPMYLVHGTSAAQRWTHDRVEPCTLHTELGFVSWGSFGLLFLKFYFFFSLSF